MTHEELLAKVNKELELAIFEDACGDGNNPAIPRALRAVVELHRPLELVSSSMCLECSSDDSVVSYPCPTINNIESELA